MISPTTRLFVRERAKNRCEYCRIHQIEYEFQSFHIEHIIAKQHGGNDDLENLCLACSECNWSKGPNLTGLVQGKLAPLFHPRKQSWSRHFRWEGTILFGKTKTGLATIAVLDLNGESRLLLRESLLFEGRFRPPS